MYFDERQWKGHSRSFFCLDNTRFQSLRFLLTNTRVPRETQVQVANVRKLWEKVLKKAIHVIE